jgi:hypothetical protein
MQICPKNRTGKELEFYQLVLIGSTTSLKCRLHLEQIILAPVSGFSSEM